MTIGWGSAVRRATPVAEVIVLLGLLAAWMPRESVAGENRVSEPGRYEGYSEALFDGWQRSSQYVTVRDGTRIAVDILRPTKGGVVHQEPLPVIWENRRYHRASLDPNGDVVTQLDRQDHPMRKVVLHGYVFAVADVRGAGASFGARVDPTPPVESLDAYDVTEWLAARSWCSGKVGMYGISYSGTDQLTAAAAAPPHLKAIFPEMAMFDLYDSCYPGGILHHTFMERWQKQVQGLDLHQSRKAAPVDEDRDEALLRQALQQHQGNFDVTGAADAPFRDAVLPQIGRIYMDNTPSGQLEGVNKSGVAVYLRAGWFDMYPRDMLLWFCNLRTPKKIVIGPWDHYQSNGLDRGTEMLRWYDYWLKGIDNGIMDEPPILYYVMGAPGDKAIRWARQWPLPQAKPTAFHLCPGPSGSVKSAHDGSLSLTMGAPGADAYLVDYGTTSGSRTRWTGGAPAYTDMAPNDQKALTYTTEPLAQPVELIGHPVMHLWLRCPIPDIDVFAYVEDVDAQGRSSYLTEGCLRASRRALAEPPCDMIGLPYHPHGGHDARPLPDGPVELVFDLLPTARHFAAGHRIRIAITCADKDSYQTPQHTPAPTIQVLRDSEHPSRVILPVVGQ
jgi:putative CocE/NonD family hydrolase